MFVLVRVVVCVVNEIILGVICGRYELKGLNIA